jgi:hypothetical protein
MCRTSEIERKYLDSDGEEEDFDDMDDAPKPCTQKIRI